MVCRWVRSGEPHVVSPGQAGSKQRWQRGQVRAASTRLHCTRALEPPLQRSDTGQRARWLVTQRL